jgi:hypothetical protein
VIRKAVNADVLRLVQLGQQFWYESDAHLFFGEYDPIHVQKVLNHGFSIRKLYGWVALHEKNVEGGIVVASDSCLWNDSKILKELAWFCAQDKRGFLDAIRLYKEMEKYAIANNYNQLIMGRIKGVPSYSKLDGFYKKQGFSLLEEEYVKKL